MTPQFYEDIACGYIASKGLLIIERNYKWPGGEIDIVAKDHHEVVFVEVKFRKSDDFGSPMEKITAPQIRRIHLTAHHFLEQHQEFAPAHFRCDAIGISPVELNPQQSTSLFPADQVGSYQFEWIQNAF